MDKMIDHAQKWFVGIIMGGMLTGIVFLFTPFFDQVKEVWATPEALVDIQQTQVMILDQLTSLNNTVNEYSGENRVIRQPPGLSYVEEPVHIGDEILNIYYVLQRTDLGASCDAVAGKPFFIDNRNIPIPAADIKVRNIDTNLGPLRVPVELPDEIKPGSVAVYIVMEYSCNGKKKYDSTDPIRFLLIERKR